MDKNSPNNIRERYHTLRAMHHLVTRLNDETAYLEYWVHLVPDQPSNNDLWDIAEDIEMYSETCRLFRKLFRVYGDDGLYSGGVNA